MQVRPIMVTSFFTCTSCHMHRIVLRRLLHYLLLQAILLKQWSSARINSIVIKVWMKVRSVTIRLVEESSFCVEWGLSRIHFVNSFFRVSVGPFWSGLAGDDVNGFFVVGIVFVQGWRVRWTCRLGEWRQLVELPPECRGMWMWGCLLCRLLCSSHRCYTVMHLTALFMYQNFL